MDDIIFEDPSKQVSRPKKSSRRVLLPEGRAAHDGTTQTQERESVLQNQKRNDPDPDIIGSVELIETPTVSMDRRDDQRHRSNNDGGDDDDTVGGRLTFPDDLFSLSGSDGYSTDRHSPISVDEPFSLPEQNEPSGDSDTSLESTSEKMRSRMPRGHSAAAQQIRQGDNQCEPIVLEDDESDNDTFKPFRFRKRKPGSELGGFDSRIPLSLSNPKGDHTMDDRESQCGDEDIGRHNSTTITRKRHRHGDHGRVGERDDDGDGTVGVRDANRQTVLGPLRRNVKDTANWTSQRAKKRHRSVSSEFLSSDESDRSDRVVAPRKNTTQSQSHFSRPHRHGDSPSFPAISSEDLTPDREGRTTADILQSSGRGDLALTDRAIRSDPKRVNSSSRLQEAEEMAQSDSNGARLNAEDGQETAQDEIEWPYGYLLDYKEVDGKPLVLVPWYPTWEPPDEYPTAEIKRVKRRWQSQRRGKGRGRARLGRDRG